MAKQQPQNAPIVLVGGNKGGVGKSLVCDCCVEILHQAGSKFKIVESDTGNPDVYYVYNEIESCEAINLDKLDGWKLLVSIAESNPETTILVNLAARTNDSIKEYGHILNDAIPELRRDVHTIWVMGRQRDCITALEEYEKTIKSATLDVVLNGFFSANEPSKFKFYNTRLKERIEKDGGKTVMLPDLDDIVADAISGLRIPIRKITNLPEDETEKMKVAKELKEKASIGLAERIEAQHWFNIVQKNFGVLEWLPKK